MVTRFLHLRDVLRRTRLQVDRARVRVLRDFYAGVLRFCSNSRIVASLESLSRYIRPNLRSSAATDAGELNLVTGRSAHELGRMRLGLFTAVRDTHVRLTVDVELMTLRQG